ncbi:S24 family peptidase [Photobacterium leiognathi]|uniref:S24 family peptidase n=1 Tax=Photobacterium leiognathi TaxID=553611 RepID=UPI00298284DA|nr:S24 family peptidase [Photobacterium leiognathi]
MKHAVGFENLTLKYRRKTLNINNLFLNSHSSMRIMSAENSYPKLNITKEDWLLIDSALTPLNSDTVIFELHGDNHIARWNLLCQHIAASGKEWDDLHVLGVITLCVHHLRPAPPLPNHHDLNELDLHNFLITQEYSTLFCRAAGQAMLPTINDGDLLILERHLEPQSHDVAVVSLNDDLVVKRLNLERGLLYCDNPQYPDYKTKPNDYLRLHGVVTRVLKLFRPLTVQS